MRQYTHVSPYVLREWTFRKVRRVSASKPETLFTVGTILTAVACRKCGELAEPVAGQGRICRDCLRAYQKSFYRSWCTRTDYNAKRAERYYRDRKDQSFMEAKRKRGREYWASLRHDAVMAYGGYVCACCGVSEPKFLTLDHIFNDGAAHRKQIKNRGAGIFKWLRDHSYPAGFQVLCMNCNHGKSLNGGVCPHKTQSSPAIPLRQQAGA